jgi:hypothetical protein
MSELTQGTDRAYDRGRRDARLDSHDALFRRLEFAQILSSAFEILGLGFLGLVTQRLGDKANASAATAIALAEALKIEKDTARETLALETSKSSSKWGKTQTVAAAASSVIAFLGYIYITHH